MSYHVSIRNASKRLTGLTTTPTLLTTLTGLTNLTDDVVTMVRMVAHALPMATIYSPFTNPPR